MNHFTLKAIRHLSVADVLELAEDVRLFRVMRIEAGTDEGKRKVHVQSMDGSTRLTLVRQTEDQVRVAAKQ